MKIALYAYGSIVNNPFSDNYDNGIELASCFEKTHVQVPLSFSRFSSKDTNKERLTLVPDENGIETPLFCATVQSTNLNKALVQLRAREGIKDSNVNKDKYVSYIKKGSPKPGSTAKTIMIAGGVWSYRINHISEEKVKEMVLHLKSQGYQAGIITTFDSNTANNTERKARIATRPLTKTNSQNYYNDLPKAVKKVHKTSLKNLGVL